MDDNTVRCTCCSRRCIIKSNDAGFCRVRWNHDGELYLALYGHPCALQVDPIEKKPLYHFLLGTRTFSIGTVGCNFRCSFCQNWRISQVVPSDPSERSRFFSELSSGVSFSPKRIAELAVANGCQSISFTYNEPTIWGEYAHDIAEESTKRGLKTVYVTNGYMTREHIDFIRPFLSAMNIDLKGSSSFYRSLCGAALDPVCDTIRYAKESGIWVEVTTLIIPGENDGREELTRLAELVALVSLDIPWHVTAFHPDFRMTNKEWTPLRSLKMAVEIGRKVGLKYIYAGNVDWKGGEDTCCPKCGTKLIERHGMSANVINGTGVCAACGYRIAGIWEKNPLLVCCSHSILVVSHRAIRL